jgi:hypothetical protein
MGIAGLAAGIYAIGNRPDAEPFVQNRKATNARYYQNNKALIKVRRAGRQTNHFASLISQVTK